MKVSCVILRDLRDGIERSTYIRHLILVRVVEDVVKHIDRSLGLDGDSGAHSQTVNVLDKLLRARFGITVSLGRLGGGGVDGGLVVEAVQVAAGFLEILDPFLWLLEPVSPPICVLSSQEIPSSCVFRLMYVVLYSYPPQHLA